MTLTFKWVIEGTEYLAVYLKNGLRLRHSQKTSLRLMQLYVQVKIIPVQQFLNYSYSERSFLLKFFNNLISCRRTKEGYKRMSRTHSFSWPKVRFLWKTLKPQEGFIPNPHQKEKRLKRRSSSKRTRSQR